MNQGPKNFMTRTTSIISWLDHLIDLTPPRGVILVGAGSGKGDWVQFLDERNLENVTLIEGDEKQFQGLCRNVLPRDSWRMLDNVVANEAGQTSYFQASYRSESGLLNPEDLRGIWSNLTTIAKDLKTARPLADIQKETEDSPNWVIIDCLPALPILQGDNDPLHSADVVVARVVRDDEALKNNAPATLTSVTKLMLEQGWRLLATEEDRNPAIGYALYIKDPRTQAQDLTERVLEARKELEACQTNLIHEVEARQEAELSLTSVRSENQALLVEKTNSESDYASLEQKFNTQNQTTETLDAALKETKSARSRLENGLRERDDRITALKTELAGMQATDDVLGFVAESNTQLKNSLQTDLSQFTKGLSESSKKHQETIKQIEARLHGDINKGLANAVKQIESFMNIQAYWQNGDNLPQFHGWPISPDLGLFLIERLREYQYDLIIEFGSGTSTTLLAKAAEESSATRGSPIPKIVSFEHDENYHSQTSNLLIGNQLAQRVQLVHSPLVDWNDGSQAYEYYNCKATLEAIVQEHPERPLRILVLVDGPPAATCVNARYPAIPIVFGVFKQQEIDVILDDAHRQEEKTVIELWQSFWEPLPIRISDEILTSEKGIYIAKTKYLPTVENDGQQLQSKLEIPLTGGNRT